jgi:hypothetical protein
VRRHHDSDLTSRFAVFRDRTDFSRALVYGPTEYQGLGIPNLYISQGSSHIEQIFRSSHFDDDMTEQLIRASVEQLKLEIGCPVEQLKLEIGCN